MVIVMRTPRVNTSGDLSFDFLCRYLLSMCDDAPAYGHVCPPLAGQEMEELYGTDNIFKAMLAPPRYPDHWEGDDQWQVMVCGIQRGELIVRKGMEIVFAARFNLKEDGGVTLQMLSEKIVRKTMDALI